MRLVWVAGSRTIKSFRLVAAILHKEIIKYDVLRTGKAQGVDMITEIWAAQGKYELEESLKPEWDRFGKGAGKMRNIKGVDWCERALVIWDGISPGSKHVIDYCRETGKTVVIYHIYRPVGEQREEIIGENKNGY